MRFFKGVAGVLLVLLAAALYSARNQPPLMDQVWFGLPARTVTWPIAAGSLAGGAYLLGAAVWGDRVGHHRDPHRHPDPA